jgi:hypothetical protein
VLLVTKLLEPSRPIRGLSHVRMNRKETVFCNGVTLQNNEPASVDE